MTSLQQFPDNFVLFSYNIDRVDISRPMTMGFRHGLLERECNEIVKLHLVTTTSSASV